MKNYTMVPNEILNSSQLTIQSRYLYCNLLRHCGKDDHCFPSQVTLAREMGYKDGRSVRILLDKLIEEDIISKNRRGFNRSNTYYVTKSFEVDRKNNSYHLGSRFPLHASNAIPPKITYLKGKGKRSIKGLEKTRQRLIEMKVISR